MDQSVTNVRVTIPGTWQVRVDRCSEWIPTYQTPATVTIGPQDDCLLTVANGATEEDLNRLVELGRIPNLTALDLSQVSQLSSRMIPHLRHLHHLEYLFIAFSPRVTDYFLSVLSDFVQILPKLKV